MAVTSRAARASARLLLVVLALVLLPARAEERLPGEEDVEQPFPVPKGDTWVDRIRAISAVPMTSQVLRFNETLAAKLDPLYDLIDSITEIVETRRSKNSEEACSLRHDATWVANARTRVLRFQLPKIDETCLSLIEGERAIQKGELDRSFRPAALDSIREARKALYDATARSDLNLTLKSIGWNGAYKLSGFEGNFFGQRCQSEYAFAYRIHGKWYLRHSITNHPINEQREMWTRNYTHEYIARVDGRNFTTLRLPHRSIRNNSHIYNASVLMTSWAGRGAIGTVWSNYETDEEQALATAIRRNAIAIDLAEDSVTPSNIAILALPMAMSFVPVAFLADLDSLGMVVYGLLTDVFAAIPFLVKGIELVRSSTNRQIEVNAFYMGNETLAQMEINCAQCTGESKFGNIGWYFIVIAILMMCTGVVLEIFAARFMARRRGKAVDTGRGEEAVTGPFGAAMLESTGKGYMGGEFERAENAYIDKMEKFGRPTPDQRGWRRLLPGRGLRRRNEPTVGFRSAEQMFETGYETESVDYDIASTRDSPPNSHSLV